MTMNNCDSSRLKLLMTNPVVRLRLQRKVTMNMKDVSVTLLMSQPSSDCNTTEE